MAKRKRKFEWKERSWDFLALGLENPALSIAGTLVEPAPFEVQRSEEYGERYLQAYRYGGLVLVIYGERSFNIYSEVLKKQLSLADTFSVSVEDLIAGFVEIAGILPDWSKEPEKDQYLTFVQAVIPAYERMGAYWDYSFMGRRFQAAVSGYIRAHDALLRSI